LVDEIRSIAEWEDAGFVTNWSAYCFEYKELLMIWRKTEKLVEDIRAKRMQSFLKGFFQKPKGGGEK